MKCPFTPLKSLHITKLDNVLLILKIINMNIMEVYDCRDCVMTSPSLSSQLSATYINIMSFKLMHKKRIQSRIISRP